MEISRMTIDDIPKIAEMERTYFSQPWSEHTLSEAFADEKYLIFVCKEEEKVLGYCGLLCMGPEADIVFVCTEASARRRGIGESLMNACITEGKSCGVTDVFLEVRESNAPARAMYRKIGFEETGIRKNYYELPKENAVIMHLLA